MAEEVKAPLTKPNDLSSISRGHAMRKQNSQKLSFDLYTLAVIHTHNEQKHTSNIYNINRILNTLIIN